MTTEDQVALQRLLDKDSIVDLVHRYSYCVDHQLYDEIADLFTEDCVVDYGPEVGDPVRPRSAFRSMFGNPGGGYKRTSHQNANVLVTFETDDRATVRASVYAWHETADGDHPRLWGYYHDSVVRTPEGWRIASRQLRVLGVENWHTNWNWALDHEVD